MARRGARWDRRDACFAELVALMNVTSTAPQIRRPERVETGALVIAAAECDAQNDLRGRLGPVRVSGVSPPAGAFWLRRPPAG